MRKRDESEISNITNNGNEFKKNKRCFSKIAGDAFPLQIRLTILIEISAVPVSGVFTGERRYNLCLHTKVIRIFYVRVRGGWAVVVLYEDNNMLIFQ